MKTDTRAPTRSAQRADAAFEVEAKWAARIAISLYILVAVVGGIFIATH